jgi:hypothetical protein
MPISLAKIDRYTSEQKMNPYLHLQCRISTQVFPVPLHQQAENDRARGQICEPVQLHLELHIPAAQEDDICLFPIYQFDVQIKHQNMSDPRTQPYSSN